MIVTKKLIESIIIELKEKSFKFEDDAGIKKNPTVFLSDIIEVIDKKLKYSIKPDESLPNMFNPNSDIGLLDILNNFEQDEIQDEIITFNRAKKSELISDLKSCNISKWNKIQTENLIKFLLTMSDDEIVGYLLFVLDSEYNEEGRSGKETLAAEKFLSRKEWSKLKEKIL